MTSNVSVPFDQIAAAVRSAVEAYGLTPRADAMIGAARVRQLQELEDCLSAHLRTSGMSADAAALSALSFVSKTAEHFAVK